MSISKDYYGEIKMATLFGININTDNRFEHLRSIEAYKKFRNQYDSSCEEFKKSERMCG